ncbi:hypothetical protein PTI98_003273 [Pleurotus ostreatus]|nr:hypothetical protein PTI98_003273 [Pleurotus ostreatus]
MIINNPHNLPTTSLDSHTAVSESILHSMRARVCAHICSSSGHHLRCFSYGLRPGKNIGFLAREHVWEVASAMLPPSAFGFSPADVRSLRQVLEAFSSSNLGLVCTYPTATI